MTKIASIIVASSVSLAAVGNSSASCVQSCPTKPPQKPDHKHLTEPQKTVKAIADCDVISASTATSSNKARSLSSTPVKGGKKNNDIKKVAPKHVVNKDTAAAFQKEKAEFKLKMTKQSPNIKTRHSSVETLSAKQTDMNSNNGKKRTRSASPEGWSSSLKFELTMKLDAELTNAQKRLEDLLQKSQRRSAILKKSLLEAGNVSMQAFWSIFGTLGTFLTKHKAVLGEFGKMIKEVLPMFDECRELLPLVKICLKELWEAVCKNVPAVASQLVDGFSDLLRDLPAKIADLVDNLMRSFASLPSRVDEQTSVPKLNFERFIETIVKTFPDGRKEKIKQDLLAATDLRQTFDDLERVQKNLLAFQEKLETNSGKEAETNKQGQETNKGDHELEEIMQEFTTVLGAFSGKLAATMTNWEEAQQKTLPTSKKSTASEQNDSTEAQELKEKDRKELVSDVKRILQSFLTKAQALENKTPGKTDTTQTNKMFAYLTEMVNTFFSSEDVVSEGSVVEREDTE